MRERWEESRDQAARGGDHAGGGRARLEQQTEGQALRIEKPRLGESALPLGEAVLRNLGARRVWMTEEDMTRAWSAIRNEGRPWTVSLTFPYRGRSKRALWSFDPRTRTLRASNRVAL